MTNPNSSKILQIFLSHASEDKTRIRKLYQQLKEDGFNPWLDDERILPGQDWDYEIEKALSTSDVILLCFSNRSLVKEGYIQREYKKAMDIQTEKPEGTIFVIPVRLDKCELPHSIRELQWVDYPAQYERLLKSLQIKSSKKFSQAKVESKKSNREQKRFNTRVEKKLETVSEINESPYRRDTEEGILGVFKSLRNKIFNRETKKITSKSTEKEKTPVIENKKINSKLSQDTASSVSYLTYRQEILNKLFRFIGNGESFYIITAASMGKTRLLDFLTRSEVQKQYLGENAKQYWFIRVDPNRLVVRDESWSFYELLLSSMVADLANHEILTDLRVDLVDLNARVIQSHDLTIALRFFEMAVNKLCQVFDLRLCFLFDDFDEPYKTLSRETFSQLRAIRDTNKTKVMFGMLLRDLPENLRLSKDNEIFYELLSHNWIGLGPYTQQDALQFIQQLELRRKFPLTTVQRERLFKASGGHPGLIQALLNILIDTANSQQKLDSPRWLKWFSVQANVIEECRIIFDDLSSNEKEGITTFGRGEFDTVSPSTKKLLFTKGILQNNKGKVRFFSPLFEQYIKNIQY